MLKKIIALILMAILILALTSCGKPAAESLEEAEEVYPGLEQASQEEREAFAEACELIEEGNYVRAIDTLNGIPLYWAIQQKLLEIDQHLKKTESQFLWGEWININEISNPFCLYFYDDSFTVDVNRTESNYPRSYTFEIIEDTIVLYSSGIEKERYTYSVIDDIPHLINKDNNGNTTLDFVPAAFYEPLKPIRVELTEENWSDYFEIRPWENITKDRWGEITGHQIGCAFYVKDEFTDKLIDGSITFYLKASGTYGYIDKDGHPIEVGGETLASFSDRELFTVWSSNQTYGVIRDSYDSRLDPSGFWQMTLIDYRVVPEGSIVLNP